MHYTVHRLNSGLRVILAPMKDTQTATVLILTGTGSRYESVEENGLAHFLEHMFFKGTKKRPTALAISTELDAIGGEYNAYTSKDRTGYWAKVDAKHVGTALDVVSDIFLHAKIEQKEIERERGPVIQELNMYEDTPVRHIDDLFELLIYGEHHPLGREIIGTRENIRRFMRKDFVTYLERSYVAANTVVCVAGKIKAKEVLNQVKRRFAHMRTGDAPIAEAYAETQTEPRVFVQQKTTDQTQLMLGVRAYDLFHKDRYALSVLSTILGGGMSSRLFIAVRERQGLAYSVRSGAESYTDAGHFVTHCGVEHHNVEKTITTILAEYKRVREKIVNTDELRKAKNQILGHLAMSLEASDDVASFLAEQEVVRGEIIPPETTAARISRVTSKDVLRVAREIFTPERLTLAAIGPHADADKLRSLLTL